ncbi:MULTISPECIES: MaoC/PaaZ C-terminal domain-containing protein [unclassified Mesorhizobium]|uniref:MaoC/PaaZ C-terminal domain-containing protein n=1 Tax=unclassified Mesorhizobium TaxID=325217 RepID=UPI00333E1486
MEQTVYFEDYRIGSSRMTSGRTITETDFVVHAGHTGDFFPHHMDAEFMKTTPFGQRIAHGTLVFSVGVGLTASVVNPVAFSYGYDRLRFIKPVFIGDTIRTRTTISAREDDPKRPDSGRVVERCEVINQHGDVVLVADHIYIVERRDKPSRASTDDAET